MPTAANCWLVPLAIDGAPGVTAIETRVAPVTVSVVLPLIVPSAAEMTEDPAAAAVASPVAEIVAVAVVADAHVTVAVRSLTVASS